MTAVATGPIFVGVLACLLCALLAAAVCVACCVVGGRAERFSVE